MSLSIKGKDIEYLIDQVHKFGNSKNKDKTVTAFLKKFKFYDNENFEKNKECMEYSIRGRVYERLWDICIKFGLVTDIFSIDYTHMTGNFNLCTWNENTMSIEKYIKEPINSGNSSGYSDITLFNKETKHWIFITCKYFKDNSKRNVDDYDVQKIVTVVKSNDENGKRFYYDPHDSNNFKIYTFTTDKKSLLTKVKNSKSSSETITQHLTDDTIFDVNHLDGYFRKLIDFLKRYSKNEWGSIFNTEKPIMHLLPHQEMIVNKVNSLVKNNEKQILLACKARSGKSYMVGGIIRDNKGKNFMIITPAPTETVTQFDEDLLNRYADFKSYNIVNVKDSNFIKSEKITVNDKNNVFIFSKQLLQRYLGDNKILDIKNIDFIFFDENHYGGTTELSKEIIDTYKNEETVMVYITATYNKPLLKWNVNSQSCLTWDIISERLCKNEDFEGLRKRHGDCVDGFFNETNIQYYKKCPDMKILTNIFHYEKFKNLINNIDNTVYGFSIDTLLSIDISKAKTKNEKLKASFKYLKEVKWLLQYISGSDKHKDFPNGDLSIFERIRSISRKEGSRTTLENSSFTTQIWFLPTGIGSDIDLLSQSLEKEIRYDKVLKNYGVLIVNSKQNLHMDIKEKIRLEEINHKQAGKDGLIILAGEQLKMGISLPKVDVVILLTNTMSSDDVYQRMFRCMTEDEGKKFGFVVDLNPMRVIDFVLEYPFEEKLSEEKKLKQMFSVDFHLADIDKDLVVSKILDEQRLLTMYDNIWKESIVQKLRTPLSWINNFKISLSMDEQKKLFDLFRNVNSKTKLIREKLDPSDYSDNSDLSSETKEDLANGKIVTRLLLEEVKQSDTENKKESTKIVKLEEILPDVCLLLILLNMRTDKNKVIEMLRLVKSNNDLKRIFEEQSKIWWPYGNNIIDVLEPLIEKYCNDQQDLGGKINDDVLKIKIKLKSGIDMPDKLLENINFWLKPKDVEKKKYGEVFTPMKLVNEMLDKLPIDIWSNPNLKWFDPANGMGNFPIAVYLRLMDTLKYTIPDEKQRKKHILENMLYMSELNTKNIYICKQIFDINNEYKLNIYCGDSLELDIQKEFGVDKFDIIMGNPPYQETDDNMKSKGGTNLYTKFINNSFNKLNQNGYLLFITPISWMGPSTNTQMGSNILQNIFLKYDLYHLNLNECKKYFNVGSTFCYYLIKKSINKNVLTNVVSEYKQNLVKSEINFKEKSHLNFLPIHISPETLKLVNKIISNKNKLKISRCRELDTSNKAGKLHLNLIKDDKFKYITYHTTSKTYYSDIKLNIYEDIKILLNMSGYLKPQICKDCNITESKYYIKMNNIQEAEKIVKLLENDDIKQFLELCKYSGFNSRPVLESISYDDK